jgi:glycosyltransferase involved in cell wall biosynthesis
MRVTFVLPYAGMAGGNRVISVYADRLQRRGHQVTVVSLPQARLSRFRKLKSLLRGRGWPRDPVPEPSYFDGLAVPHRVLDRHRPVVDEDVPNADVVIATFWRTAPWVLSLSEQKGAKAIFLQGYETSPGEEAPAIDAMWRLPLHKIVISNWLAKLAQERFGDAHVDHVPNSVDTEQFHAPVRMKQAVPTVGMLYASLHLKGVDLSLAALRHVKTLIPNLRVVAFGAERVSRNLPVPEWVEFHHRPRQEDIPKLYAQCDVWLCGSRREGFHLPPLEAMACRCPVVSSRVGGPADIVRNGINGYLVDIEDFRALAEGVVAVLIKSEDDWRTMSEAALATATQYTWDDATDRFELILDRLHHAHMNGYGARLAG